MEQEPFNGNEAEQQTPQIFIALKAMRERFVQCHFDAEEAKQRLSNQKRLTATQCKRATESLFKLDNPINDLYELLKQRPLPDKIDLQLHGISLTLQQIEQHKEDLRSYIDTFTSSHYGSRGEEDRNKKEDIIRSVQYLAEQLNKLIDLLLNLDEPVVSSTPAINHPPSELSPQSEPQQDLPPTNTPTFSFLAQPTLPQSIVYRMLRVIFSLSSSIRDIYRHYSSQRTPQEPTEATSSADPNRGRTTQESMQRALLPTTTLDPPTTKNQNKEQFDRLNDLLEHHIDDLELQQICRNIGIDYQRLDDRSHATRAFSLTRKMENEVRLDELEQELRILLPKRFPDYQ